MWITEYKCFYTKADIWVFWPGKCKFWSIKMTEENQKEKQTHYVDEKMLLRMK